jgi:acyl-CoA synthetase (AMP-forming)/AMP-acid ligase II
MAPLPSPIRLGDLLDETARCFPDKEGLVFGKTRLTWNTFNQQVENLAGALLSLGVEHGDRVGIICTTRPEYLCVYMAAARIGAVLVGFNILHKPQELAELAHLTTPKVMFVIDRVKDDQPAVTLQLLFERMPFVEAYVVVGNVVPEGALSLDVLISTAWPEMDAALNDRKSQVQPDDAALIVFTSGSTGIPKGAVLTHRAILSNILVQKREFGYQSDDRALQNKPMNHVGGATNLTLPSMAAGATIVFMDRFHPVRALEIVEKENITILGQVPTMFILQFNLPDFDRYDLSTVRLAIVGGAATPGPIMQKIIQVAGTVMTGYGMTETGGYITFTHPSDTPETIAQTVGKVAPEFELRIVDSERQPVPVGDAGEVAIRGACLLAGYFENPVASAETRDADGWLYSGDLGYLDERGYLTLVDRKKDMYITGGYNVYPREIEQYLSRHPKVEMVAVFGINDAVMGEVGIACLTCVPGETLTTDEISGFCSTGLAEYKLPRRYLLRDALPLTPLGKIDKPRLRQELKQHGLLRD